MPDFTLETYKSLLLILQKERYTFMTFEQYCQQQPEPDSRVVVLRHDVDLKAANSAQTAVLESELGIKASYYFRIIKESAVPEVMNLVTAFGHELGYHYEDMTLAEGDKEKAYWLFKEHLEFFRHFYPVKTICMHGAPTSAYDGRDLWRDGYDYHQDGIIGEPYFDMDFDKAMYLTDTGRRWDGYQVSLRDKVPQQERWIQEELTFHSTEDIIRWLKQCQPKTNIMITTHPQRWSDDTLEWLSEYISQTIKNTIKRILVWAKG